MTDEERTLSTTVDLPDDAPADPERYHVALYFRREADEGSLTTSERIGAEFYALDGGTLAVDAYPFDAARVLQRLKVSWDGDWTFVGLDDDALDG